MTKTDQRTEDKKPFRLSTSPSKAFSGDTQGESSIYDLSWSDYVINGEVDPELALELQSSFGPEEYPQVVKYILRSAKREQQ